MENGPFIDDLVVKRLIFHSYVSLPEGNLSSRIQVSQLLQVLYTFDDKTKFLPDHFLAALFCMSARGGSVSAHLYDRYSTLQLWPLTVINYKWNYNSYN